jgi:hypothetical protein
MSMTNDILKLIGHRLLIQILDPWEFGTDVGTHPIPVVVERVHVSQVARREGVTRSEELVIRVEKPFAYKNHKCVLFRASPRHDGATFATLRNGDNVSTNFIRTVTADEPGDASTGKRYGRLHQLAKSAGWLKGSPAYFCFHSGSFMHKMIFT